MIRLGAQGLYVSMFDEFNEGNQIAKTAESAAFQPVNSGMRALDEDGTPCSADYYLRLTNDGGRMLKGQVALTATRFTPTVLTDSAPPSVPGNLRGTGTTDTTVALAWNASTDNTGVAGYRVARITGSTSTVVGTTGTLAFTVTGLATGTAHTFSVAAFDAAGNASAGSNQVTATTVAGNLAQGRPTAESSHTQHYGSGNAVDGNTGTYWESANHAFPQWLQVDLGSTVDVRRVVLTLPPLSAWATRTQTLSVSGSTDGSSFGQVVGPAGYTFDPVTGNTVTITFAATAVRYLRLTFTGNTGWPAGQVSEFRVHTG
jgi:chitodextrinase